MTTEPELLGQISCFSNDLPGNLDQVKLVVQRLELLDSFSQPAFVDLVQSVCAIAKAALVST